MYDGVVFAHGFFDWVTVAPLGVRTGAVRPVQVVSLLDTVVRYSKQSCVSGGCLWWSGVYNITEILNISSSIDSIYFLRFLLAHAFPAFELLKLLPTIDTYSELINYPTAHPVFISPAKFYPKSNRSLPETSFLFFLIEIQSLVTGKFWREGQRVICRRDGLPKLSITEKFERPQSSNVQVMSKTKKSAKKR